MIDFSGKQVLVTGGTSGIGRAVAQAFSLAGAEVLAIGLPGEEALPASIRVELLDITEDEAVHSLISRLPRSTWL
jgi:NAD(P)-dependent dehydrogenase (short-subunit alcohol dehydrogenase family)